MSFVTYTIIILLMLVSASIGVYMIKHKTSSVLHAVFMFIASAIFAAALVLASVRFDLLSGLVGTPAIVMMSLTWLFILSGVAYGVYLKNKRRDIYANVGRRGE